MSDITAKTWLQTNVLTDPKRYSVGGTGYAGPAMAKTVVTFFTNLNNGLASLSKVRTPIGAGYGFMAADNVINADKNQGFGYDPAYFLYDLFQAVSSRCGHSLSRYDLWHGHFVDMGKIGTGIVFHAKEQPSNVKTDGVDNSASPFKTSDACFNGRNVLWFASSNMLYPLNTGAGSDVLIHYVEDKYADWDADFCGDFTRARTVFEDDLGKPLGFVYYRCDLGMMHWKSTFIAIKPQNG